MMRVSKLIELSSAFVSKIEATSSRPAAPPEGATLSDLVNRLSPPTLLLILAGLQLLVWTILPWLTAISLPLDVTSDGLGWGHEWQWGYFKHPPLPPWEVEAVYGLFGDIGPFLLSQIAIVLTYVFVYLLGSELMSKREALIGTVLLVGVYYFSIPTPEFNHNVAQMPVWAFAAYAYTKALRSNGLRWWALLGLAGGIALLTKYASAILFLAMLAHMLTTPSARRALLRPGPYLALVVLAAVASPHILWLVHNHFPTFHYAEARAGHAEGAIYRIVAPFRFLLSQLATLAPCLIVAAAAGLLGRTREVPSPVRDENFRLLLFLGIGPALITALLSLLTGFGIRDMWGAPMWNLTGLIIVAAMRARRARVSLPRLAAWTAALFVILPFAYVLATSIGPSFLGKPSRTQWPDRAMAARLEADWISATHRPLDIVAGDGWLAGLIALRTVPRASVFVDADPHHAPWITPARLAREGALVVWQTRGSDSPPPGLILPGMKIMGVETFDWPSEPRAKPLRVGYAILPPAAR